MNEVIDAEHEVVRNGASIRTYKLGRALVIRDGEYVWITHGDPEFDAWNARMNEHMRRSFLDGEKA